MSGVVLAEDVPALTIAARAGEHPDFDRVVFDWPRDVPYKVKRDGTRVTIHFDAAAKVKFNGFNDLTRALGFRTTQDDKGNLEVSFTVNGKAGLHDFTSGHSIAVDIQGGAASSADVPAAPQEVKKPPATVADKIPALTPATPPASVSAPAAAKPVAATPTPAQSSATPSAPAAPPPAATQTPAVVVSSSVPVATVAPLPTSLVPEPIKPTVSSNMPVIQPPLLAKTGTQTAPKPPVQAPAPAAPPAAAPTDTSSVNKTGLITLQDITQTPALVVTFDPHVAARVAVWQRGGYGYLMFDRKLTVPLDSLIAGQPAPRVALENVDMPDANGYRFPVPPDVDVRATQSGTSWKIFMARQMTDMPVATTLVAQPDFALGARFLLPLPDAPKPIPMTDPVVGDTLIIVPLSKSEAFTMPRRMADFEIWPAAQGLVIRPLTDKILVRNLSDGIEITADGGLHMSSTFDTGASQQSNEKARASAVGKSIFDFATWAGKPDESFTQTRQRLQQTIVDVPERERNRARLELARFYFAHGYGEEALSMLTDLIKQLPDLAVHTDFMALYSAAKILAYRPEEGIKDLNNDVFANQPEIDLWLGVGYAEMRDWKSAEEKFSVNEAILSGYPEPFYSRFSVLAIESALAAGRDREAADWLDRLETDNHTQEIQPAIEYLHGVLHARSGRARAAEQSWKDVMQSNDRLYKVRAELALIDLGVADNSLTPAQAAERLEALRFGWRGDTLELDILHRLGQFYIQAKNVKQGMNVLNQAIHLYPDVYMAGKIKQEMSQTFHDVFLTDLGQSLSPLEALTLYQQYHDLMPTGDDGIAVMRNLAERLIAIDLLDQAAGLLDDLARNKLTGKEKAKASSRLAAVRLLDHHPEQALEALDIGNGEFLPADMQHERLLLRAKALSDLHRDDEALGLLRDNNRESAKLLRADISAHARDWPATAAALLELIGPPPKPGEVLSHDQADWLVRAATAYALAGNQTALDKLVIDYGAAMAGTQQYDTFRVLSQPEINGQLKNITAAQSNLSQVDLFQGFLNSYRTPSGTTPPAGAGVKVK
ncbi:MAG: hypothetical protein JO126_01505 [Alphaproteobacteria bacterium]|nr:hypothetical protein [Alphaproteobacteria bacterium]